MSGRPMVATLFAMLCLSAPAPGQPGPGPAAAPGKPLDEQPEKQIETITEKADDAKGPVALNKEGTVLLDAKRKILTVKSRVVLRQGMLEMLLCKAHTKEHESILAFDGHAFILHAGLVALGVDPGTPVQFQPDFKTPEGPKLKIELVWTGNDGKEHRADARSWVRHSIHRYFGEPLEALPPGLVLPQDSDLRYDKINKQLSWYGPMTVKQRDELLALSRDETFRKAVQTFYDRGQSRPMETDWVFVGSMFARDEESGRKVYLAESGDVICVANFPTAMIDVAAQSSATGQENLLFEAWTERIPAVGTAVQVQITPVVDEPEAGKQVEPKRNGKKVSLPQD